MQYSNTLLYSTFSAQALDFEILFFWNTNLHLLNKQTVTRHMLARYAISVYTKMYVHVLEDRAHYEVGEAAQEQQVSEQYVVWVRDEESIDSNYSSYDLPVGILNISFFVSWAAEEGYDLSGGSVVAVSAPLEEWKEDWYYQYM